MSGLYAREWRVTRAYEDLGVLSRREVPSKHVLKVDHAGEARVASRALEEKRHRRDAIVPRAAHVVPERPAGRLTLAGRGRDGVEADGGRRDSRLGGRAWGGQEQAELLCRAQSCILCLDGADVDAL